LYKQVWIRNVKKLLAQNNLSISEAARLIGTSKQYLSAILNESEPQSVKEQVLEKLSWLLHSDPSKLYTPEIPQEGVDNTVSQATFHAEDAASAPEMAILAERHFLSQDYVGCLSVVGKLLNEYSWELSPAATAQALLLAGKCCCLQGKSADARLFLRDALSLFQKRLSAQPTKYLPLCMDAYRYLALAEYADEQYVEAVKSYQRIFVLARRYPELSSELLGKVESAGNGLLRAAVKQGRLSIVKTVADEIEAFAEEYSMEGMVSRAAVERAFCIYVVTPNHGLRLPDSAECFHEPLAALQYGLLLWESGQYYELSVHAERLQTIAESELVFVARWLQGLLALSDYSATNLAELSALLQPEWPSVYRSIILVMRALRLSLNGDNFSAAYLWQEALFTLKQNKEFAFYLFILRWHLRTIDQSINNDERGVLLSVLTKAVDEFAR